MNFTICSFLLLILASFCFSVSNNIKGKKVLVYLPVTGHSHLKFMSTTSNILQEEGYNVVSVIISFSFIRIGLKKKYFFYEVLMHILRFNFAKKNSSLNLRSIQCL